MFIYWSTIWKYFSTTVILDKPFAQMIEMRNEKYTAWFGFVGCDLNFDLGVKWDGESKTAWISTHCWWFCLTLTLKWYQMWQEWLRNQMQLYYLSVSRAHAQVLWLPTLDKRQIVSNVPWGPGLTQRSWALEHNTYPTMWFWVKTNNFTWLFRESTAERKRILFPGVIHTL